MARDGQVREWRWLHGAGLWGRCRHAQEKPKPSRPRGLPLASRPGVIVGAPCREVGGVLTSLRQLPPGGWLGQRWPLQLKEGRAWLPCSFPKLLPEKSDRAWVLGVGRAGPVELATCLPPLCSASFCTRTSILCMSPSGPELPPSHRIRLSESPGQTAE